jgi:hypothetical protein
MIEDEKKMHSQTPAVAFSVSLSEAADDPRLSAYLAEKAGFRIVRVQEAPVAAPMSPPPQPAASPENVPLYDSTNMALLDDAHVAAFMAPPMKAKTKKLLRAFVPTGRASLSELVRLGGYKSARELTGFTSGITKRARNVLGGTGEFYRFSPGGGGDSDEPRGFYFVSDVTAQTLTRYFSSN